MARSSQAGETGDGYQVDDPQRSIRGEGVDPDDRGGRYSWGESRAPRWAERHLADLLAQGVRRRTAAVRALSEAHSALQAYLLGLLATSVGEPGLQNQVARQHALDGTVRDAEGARRLGRRAWVAGGMRWTVVATLALADLFFFLQLWRDIEDATSWWSVETLQALLYAVVTPVVTALVAGVLGRVAAARVHAGDQWTPAHTRRAAVVAVPAVVVVAVVWFAVVQRHELLTGLVGAVPVSRTMTFLIFVLLPLGLFVCEIFVHDEESTLHGLRAQDKNDSDQVVEREIAAVTELHGTVVARHLDVQELLSTMLLELPESLSAGVDLLEMEWAAGDAHGDWATLLPETVQVHLPSVPEARADVPTTHVPGCGAWPELDTLGARLEQMARGGALPIDLSEIAEVQQALVGFAPPRIETVLATLSRALGTGRLSVEEDGGLVLSVPWEADDPAVEADRPQLHAVDAEELA